MGVEEDKKEIDLDIVAIIHWQQVRCSELICKAMLEGENVTDSEVIKKIWNVVAEETKKLYGI